MKKVAFCGGAASEEVAFRWAYAPGPLPQPWEAPVAAIAFLTRGEGEPTTTVVTPGEAVTRLWESRVQPRHSGTQPDPAEAARALRGVRLAQVTTSRIGDVAAAVAALLD